MDGLDPYAVLKLENGEAATDAEIRKVRTQRPRSTGGSAHDPPRENPDAEARDVVGDAGVPQARAGLSSRQAAGSQAQKGCV